MSGKHIAKRRGLRSEEKPGIAMIGAGNLARALSLSLHQAGYAIDVIVSREEKSSRARAQKFASEIRVPVVDLSAARINSDVVWFCVPDDAIRATAGKLKSATEWRDRIALHSSGALTSDELHELRQKGARAASVHPMMTFVRGTKPDLAGVSFPIEGDAKAVRVACSIVKNLGGQAYSIQKDDKAAYHAWGTFASPLFTALLATCEHVAGLAGVEAKSAKARMLPLLRQTLENYAKGNAASAFSGPIIRGDVHTIRRHLGVLQEQPIAREVYVALAKAALAYLPAKNEEIIARDLESPRTQELRRPSSFGKRRRG